MFFSNIKKDFDKIPAQIKWVTFVVSLWMLGWGFVDPLLSIYLNSIVNNLSLV